MTRRLKVLQLHSSYSSAEISGENSSVQNISKLLSEDFSVDTIIKSTSMLKNSRISYLFHGFKFILIDFKLIRKALNYDVIIVHNVNPFISSLSLRIIALVFHKRIVLYWHNSRRFCINGLNFRNGKDCHLCNKKNKYLLGIFFRCYRGSLLESIAVTISEGQMRKLSKMNSVTNIVFSSFYQQKLLNFGIQPSRIKLVPYSIKFSQPNVKKKGNELDFIAIGRLDREKGFEELLVAWSQIGKDERRGKRLHIVGSGPMEMELRKQFSSSDVIFWGKQDFDTIIEIAKSCSTGIVTSQCAESFCKVVIELYSIGVPVLGTPVGALPELISKLDASLILRGTDISSIKLGILGRFKYPRNYGDLPQEIVSQEFTEEVWKIRMKDLITKTWDN